MFPHAGLPGPDEDVGEVELFWEGDDCGRCEQGGVGGVVEDGDVEVEGCSYYLVSLPRECVVCAQAHALRCWSKDDFCFELIKFVLWQERVAPFAGVGVDEVVALLCFGEDDEEVACRVSDGCCCDDHDHQGEVVCGCGVDFEEKSGCEEGDDEGPHDEFVMHSPSETWLFLSLAVAGRGSCSFVSWRLLKQKRC